MNHDPGLEQVRTRLRDFVERKQDEGFSLEDIVAGLTAAAFRLGAEIGLTQREVQAILDNPDDARLHLN